MFTPKQVSEHLEIPPSTLRRYCSLWADYLSETARITGKKRQFTNEDITTLRKIRDLTNKRKSPNEIAAALQEPDPEPPLTGEVFEDLPPGPETETQGAIQSIEFFSQVIDQLTDEHKTALTAKDEMITELKEDKDRLQNELSWLRLPWWRRAFRDPPK